MGSLDLRNRVTMQKVFLICMLLAIVKTFAHTCSENDKSIWKNEGQANFDHDMTTCDSKCFFESLCTEIEIRKLRHYSEMCSKAFGEFSKCTMEHCWMFCRPLEAHSCLSCKKEHCDRSFYAQTGFESSNSTSSSNSTASI